MIIRKKNIQNKKNSTTSSQEVSTRTSTKRNVIKKEDVAILDVESAKNTNETLEKAVQSKPQELPAPQKISEEEEFEKIDISLIEFKERVERRRGDRRRGYRRIDERSLVTRAQQEAHTIKELAAREGYKNGFAEAQGQLDDINAKLAEFLVMRDEMY